VRDGIYECSVFGDARGLRIADSDSVKRNGRERRAMKIGRRYRDVIFQNRTEQTTFGVTTAGDGSADGNYIARGQNSICLPRKSMSVRRGQPGLRKCRRCRSTHYSFQYIYERGIRTQQDQILLVSRCRYTAVNCSAASPDGANDCKNRTGLRF